MTHFSDKPAAGKLVKLSGKIGRYCSTKASAGFVYSEIEQKKLGAVAAGAALVGMGCQAAAVTGHASGLDEAAEYVEFELNGDRIRGWVWRSPFREGDVVDVAAEWIGNHYEAFGIARPVDKMIALYPHCSGAKGRHLKKPGNLSRFISDIEDAAETAGAGAGAGFDVSLDRISAVS